MPWMFVLALIGACAEPASPIIRVTDTGDVSGCPEGMTPAQSASLLIDYMVLNWINLYPTYDNANTYTGGPATCIQTDGMGVRQVFEINGQPYGTITISASEVGTIDLPTFTGTFEVDLYGADVPVVFDAATDFDSGTLILDAMSGNFSAEATMEAYSDTQQLTMHFFSEASTTP